MMQRICFTELFYREIEQSKQIDLSNGNCLHSVIASYKKKIAYNFMIYILSLIYAIFFCFR